MNKALIIPVVFVFVLIFSACREDSSPFSYPDTNKELITIERGIWGNVWYWEGYFDPPDEFGKITPVEREIHIYKRVHFDSMDNKDEYPFFSYIDSEFFGSVRSDINGFYQVQLDSGDYSLFIIENDRYYAVEVNDSGFVQSSRLNNRRDSLRMKNLNITTAATFEEF
jgi:hypothetical protein